MKMFIETFSYRKVGAIGGIVGSMKGRWAIIGNEGFSYNLAFTKHPFGEICRNKILYLNSYFVSGYDGSNYAGTKDRTHYTNAMLKVIRQLDKTFKIDADGKATSKDFTIKIVEFGREMER